MNSENKELLRVPFLHNSTFSQVEHGISHECSTTFDLQMIFFGNNGGGSSFFQKGFYVEISQCEGTNFWMEVHLVQEHSPLLSFIEIFLNPSNDLNNLWLTLPVQEGRHSRHAWAWHDRNIIKWATLGLVHPPHLLKVPQLKPGFFSSLCAHT